MDNPQHTLSGAGDASAENQAVAISEPIPADCDPDRYLDWRFRYGYQLAENTAKRPIQHADPWVEEAANFFAICRDGWGNRQPSGRQRALKEAWDIAESDTLEKDILQSRLIAQQAPEEIAGKCRFSAIAIEAYSALHFDVQGQRKRMWFAGPLLGVNCQLSLKPSLGEALKSRAFLKGSKALEEAIEVVLGLDGPNLAHDLSDNSSPEGRSELLIRMALAMAMLPRRRKMAELAARMQRATLEAVRFGQPTEEAYALVVEVLVNAKLPVALRRQIAQLRRSSSVQPVLA